MRIKTVAELVKAIKSSDEVVTQIKFGTHEDWVKITKKEALIVASALEPDATPEHMEMYSGDFGSVKDGVLYLG